MAAAFNSTIVDIIVLLLTPGEVLGVAELYNSRYYCQFIDTLSGSLWMTTSTTVDIHVGFLTHRISV